MIYIFYSKTSLTRLQYEHYLNQLPASFRRKILQYRNRKDAQRSLFGKLLLQKGLKILGLEQYQLSDMRYTSHQRPYFDQTLDFNIAHSGEYVICAISTTQKVGVDIEELKHTELHDFQDFFTSQEWSKILQSSQRLHEFYTMWTQKEAIVKASGQGLSIPLQEVLIRENRAMVSNEQWHLIPLSLNQNYVSHLATNSLSSEIILQQLDFD